MMQFLMKTLLSKDSIDPMVKSLQQEIDDLKQELLDQKKILIKYNDTLRDYSNVNQVLCREVSVLGRWLASQVEDDSQESEDFKSVFGVSDSDDDEYLN